MLNRILEEAQKECNVMLHMESNVPDTEGIWVDEQIIKNFLSHSLTKGIQQAMEEIRLERISYVEYSGDHRFVDGYLTAKEELDTKINKLMQ